MENINVKLVHEVFTNKWKEVKFLTDVDIVYIEEVIEILGGKVSYRSVLNLVRERELPAVKVGKRLLFSRKVVERWRDKKLGIA